MADLTRLFPDEWIELTHLMSGDALDQLAMPDIVAHTVADVVQRMLRSPGADPRGLTVTISESDQGIKVTGTTPKFDA